MGKQSVPKRGSVGSFFNLSGLHLTRTRRYRVSVLTVCHLRVYLRLKLFRYPETSFDTSGRAACTYRIFQKLYTGFERSRYKEDRE